MRVVSRLWLFPIAISLVLSACSGAPSPHTPTPAIALHISTPFAAAAAATPPARLHAQPGEAPGPALDRGTALQVEDIKTTGDGQLWYQVRTTDGASGWLPAAAVSLVDKPVAIAHTPLPTLTPTPTPPASTSRPLVVAGSGQGLFLRARPGQGDVIRAYPDGTAITPLGEELRLDGRRWLRVRAPDGREGWMAAEYLRPS